MVHRVNDCLGWVRMHIPDFQFIEARYYAGDNPHIIKNYGVLPRILLRFETTDDAMVLQDALKINVRNDYSPCDTRHCKAKPSFP